MRVLVLKQSLSYLDSLKKLDSPVNFYGFTRKSEHLCYVFSLGENPLHLPCIGQLSMDGSVRDNLRLLGIFVEGKLQFYYKQKQGWEKVEHCIVDQKDSYNRTPFSDKAVTVLNNACVALFGVGSIGSRLALGLVRSGVGKFKLCDPGVLHIEDIFRHECTTYDLSRFKVVAVRERMLRVNPLVEIKTYRYDVFQMDKHTLDRFFQKLNLVIATTDKTFIQSRVNHECWKRGIPALFARCYDGARGGEILYTIPGETLICYDCLRGTIKQLENKDATNHSNALDTDNFKNKSGLSVTTNLIADVTAQYAIALLLRKEECEIAKLIDPKKNLAFISTALGQGFDYVKGSRYFERPFQFVYPDIKGSWKKCSTCQNTPTKKTANEIIKKHKIQVI
jgi:molybdopterin/thiamine biosynthesis adenylyltransferase